MQSDMAIIDEFEDSNICPQCGADLRLLNTRDSLICDYCDTMYFLNGNENSNHINYDFITPINLSEQQITERFYEICYTEFAPHDFKENAVINKIKSIFIPFFSFDVACDVHYTLEVGHDETKKVYNDVSNKWEEKTITVYETKTGGFTEEYNILTKGFNLDNINLDSTKILEQKKNLKEFLNFCSAITTRNAPLNDIKPYSPYYISNNDIVETTSEKHAWNNEGSSTLDSKIQSSIASLYSARTRNIRFHSNTSFLHTKLFLYGAAVVSYNYNDLSDQLVLMDGSDGSFYRGVIPLSSKKVALTIAKWLGSAGIITAGILLSKNLNGAGQFLFPIATIILAIVFWLWLGSLKGTSGRPDDINISQNKTNNKRGILITSILAIITAIIFASSYEPPFKHIDIPDEPVMSESAENSENNPEPTLTHTNSVIHSATDVPERTDPPYSTPVPSVTDAPTTTTAPITITEHTPLVEGTYSATLYPKGTYPDIIIDGESLFAVTDENTIECTIFYSDYMGYFLDSEDFGCYYLQQSSDDIFYLITDNEEVMYEKISRPEQSPYVSSTESVTVDGEDMGHFIELLSGIIKYRDESYALSDYFYYYASDILYDILDKSLYNSGIMDNWEWGNNEAIRETFSEIIGGHVGIVDGEYDTMYEFSNDVLYSYLSKVFGDQAYDFSLETGLEYNTFKNSNFYYFMGDPYSWVSCTNLKDSYDISKGTYTFDIELGYTDGSDSKHGTITLNLYPNENGLYGFTIESIKEINLP